MYRIKSTQQLNQLSSGRLYIAALSVIVLFLLTACSGGTVGTSSTRPVKISGKLVNESGEAVSHVDVTVLETGDSDRTDEEGRFEIQSEAVDDDASLILESSDLSSSVVVGPLQEDSEVKLDLVISESGQVKVSSLVVRPLSATGGEEGPLSPANEGEEEEGDSPDDVDSTQDPISLPKGYSLVTGSVQNNRGHRLSDILVELAQDGLRLTTSTGSRGRFSIKGPLKAKSLKIKLYKKGKHLGTAEIGIPSRSVHVEVALRITFAEEDDGSGIGSQGDNRVEAYSTIIKKRSLSTNQETN
jgi:hypothetical protein